MEDKEKPGGAEGDDEQKSPGSLTHRAGGVNITITVKDEKDGQKKPGQPKDPKDRPKKPPLYKRRAFLITVPLVAAVLIGAFVLFWLHLRQYVSTDDAYIDGYVSQISSRVSAQVVALHIVDNQFVHKGDLLVELDPTDFEVAMQQAGAQVASSKGHLEEARAQVITAQASIRQADAEADAAKIASENADRDLKRYQEVDARARSRQQLDQALTAQKNAQAQLETALARKISAEANVTNAEASVEAARGELQTSEANRRRAEVNLSYCKIFAPTDGRVTERSVSPGNYVAPGQALLMLVDPNVWVTANFKETQLTHLRPGQPVTIQVDAYPDRKWHGRVDSIQAGSGSRFSVLPAENATGNYVKVVQRVPVKIVFDHGANTNDAPLLSPGLSVEPTVKISS